MLTDEAEAVDRPAIARSAQAADPLAVTALMDLLKDACAPIAIVGGAGWCRGTAAPFAEWAERIGLPVAAPSAARIRSRTTARSGPAISATAPIPSSSSG
jgi:thiamine pyrophosphate-dependent acetolactate synthase large subunit-like protein